jgi:hypothetical protein
MGLNMKVLFLCLLFFSATWLPAAEEVNPYQQLSIEPGEKQLIAKLLTTMANNNVFQLLLEKGRLEKIGRNIHHIHPMRFLGTVFTDRDLTWCMREIRKSHFKWDGFIDGFAERMKGEAAKVPNNLLPYVEGFAREVSRDPEMIRSYIKSQNFEGLVKFLISTS